MENNLISIIIPVYNAQRYLTKCMESIINQTHHELQILLIDDGSTDNSLAICQKYAKSDSRIEIISQKNLGVSSARNRGLAAAKGKYIYFADSDDYMETNLLEILYQNMIAYQADCSICGFTEIRDNHIRHQTSGDFACMSQKNAINLLLMQDSFRGYLWNKLFKTSYILQNHLQFQEDIYIWEDILFILKYLIECKKVVYDPKPLYYYIQHQSSALNNRVYTERIYTLIKANEYIIKELPDYYILAKDIAFERYTQNALILLRKLSFSDIPQKEHRKMKKKCQNIIRKNYKRYFKDLTTIDKISAIIVCVSPSLFEKLYYMANRKRKW